MDGRGAAPHLDEVALAAAARAPAAPLVVTRPARAAREERLGAAHGEHALELVRVASSTAPIHVDTCAVCGGKWLDGGELELLQGRGVGARVRRLIDWVLDLDLGR